MLIQTFASVNNPVIYKIGLLNSREDQKKYSPKYISWQIILENYHFIFIQILEVPVKEENVVNPTKCSWF